MSFSVQHQYHPETESLLTHVEGEFRGVTVMDFENDILSEIRTGKAKHVVFEMSKATYVDSAAIEFLFKCAKICKEAEQTLRLSKPRESLRKLFAILRVERVIPIDL